MKKMIAILGLMSVSLTAVANQSEFDAQLERGLQLGAIVSLCQGQGLTITSKVGQQCIVALNEGAKAGITIEELKAALQFKKSNSETDTFDVKLNEALNAADHALIEKRKALLETLESNK
jgi:hypothetical protein